MLKISKSAPFEEDIEKATSENNVTEDWSLILHICDIITNYQEGPKICFKAIIKRLHHNVPKVVMHTLTLLDACVKNCDRHFLLQVASSEFTNEVRKLLGKMHPAACDKLKELIQKWSFEEFKDDPELGIIPSLYYKLKSEGVIFPPIVNNEKEKKLYPISTNPDAVTSQEEENDLIKALEISLKDVGRYNPPVSDSGSSSFASNSQAPTKTFKVRAMYDFEAAEDNELTIQAGEIVLVLDNSNINWWKGSNHRGEGLFPANFVTEDLDYKAEDLSVDTKPVEEVIPNATYTGEVKIDEEKIELVINWLNDTDPAGETQDPEDMLRLEDEVYKMGPLIEEKLESVDKRLAMLNQVNEKIVAAFVTFHSLDDNMASMQGTMKYPVKNFPPSLPQVSAATGASITHPLPPHPMMFYPVPAPQPFPDSNPPASMPETMPQLSNQQASMPPGTTSENPSGNSSVTSSAVASSSQAGPTNAMMNPYNQTMSGFYMPQGMPFPVQYPSGPVQHGFVQTSGPTPNFMSVPHYSMPTMGPYIPFPYYYPNSASPAPVNTPVPSANPTPDNTKLAATTITPALNNTPSVSTHPTYSSDLNSLALSNLDVSPLQEKREPSNELSHKSSSEPALNSI